MTTRARAFGIAAGCLLAADLVLTVAAGFHYGFTLDDLMNFHRALTTTWTELAADCLAFWSVSPVFRPAAIALLKAGYSIWGMNLFAWRCFYGAGIVIAVCLGTGATWRLTRRPAAAWIAGLLLSYEAGFRWLYFSMGFVFDLVAAVFVFLFLLIFPFGGKPRTGFPAAASVVIVLILGLESKEIAIDALVFVCLYDLILNPPESVSGIAGWLGQRWVLLLCCGAGIVFTVGHATGVQSLVQFPAYRMSFGWGTYWSHAIAWVRQFRVDPITPKSSAIVIPLLAAAVVASWRLSLWSILAFLIGVLPVAFIPLRTSADLFVPGFPIAVLGGLAVDGIGQMAGRFGEGAKWAVVAAICLALVMRQGAVANRMGDFRFGPVDEAVGPALLSARSLRPVPGGDGRMVVDSDPFEDSQWSDLFLFRLALNSPQLQVKRPGQLTDEERQADGRGEWRHIAWCGKGWVETAQSFCRE